MLLSWQDLRYALRLLRRSPLFTALTVVVLGGGLGLSVFTYSFLHTAILRPLPLADGERLVRVQQATEQRTFPFDAVDLALIRPAITTLSEVGAYAGRALVLGDEGRRRVIDATAVEWRMFDVTRTPPALGRGFRPDDQARGAEPVIVLGHRTWRVAFGGDSTVVDRTVLLDGKPTRVVGVMPDGYGFPVAADAWVPLGADVLATTTRGTHTVSVYGRLAPGVRHAAAGKELETLLAAARQGRPATAADSALPPRVLVRSFPMAQLDGDGPVVLTVLNLLALLILLLACVNVTNLLLARANERARETAVRLALGATRGRLIVQSLWETALLCLAGGALATALAAWGLAAINAWAQTRLEGNLAFWWVWGADRTTFLAAAAFVTVTIALLGGVAAARATATRFDAVLRDGGARGGGRREGRVARVLVATQVATVSVLMFFGVLSGITARRVANTDLGYDTRALLAAAVEPPPGDRYATRAARGAFYETLVDDLTRRPAVDGAVVQAALADGGEPAGEVALEGRDGGGEGAPRAHVRAVLGPLTALGIATREGRPLDARDREGAVPVAVVSQAFARRHWPRGPAVGRRVRLAGLGEGDAAGTPNEWRTVVGVVSDVLLGDPLSRDRSASAVYVPLRQSDVSRATVLFRHRGDALAARVALHETLAAADPLVLPPDVTAFDEVLEKSTMLTRSVAKLFAACFGFALVLAVSGTYALMARSIGRRTREIGVRRALGATDAAVARALLGQGGRQLGVGAVAALPGMLLVGVGFARFFPVGLALALGTGVAVSAAIVGVVLAATYVPARRALGIEVRDALWRE